MIKRDFSKYRLNDILEKQHQMGIVPLDVLLTGVTGAGKSTTINAIFQQNVAVKGNGVYPETMRVSGYALNKSLRLWDTPGLGDGVEQDRRHIEELKNILQKSYKHPRTGKIHKLIDMVIVIIEGSNRDMGTTYRLINDVIVPNIQGDRIFVLINQADVAMKNRHWDSIRNVPDPVLKRFLEEQAYSIQKRVREATGVSILKPVYYSAECGYNVEAVLDFLIDYMPINCRE